MRSQDDSFAIINKALEAAAGAEADALFVSTDQNISRFANSSLHQNMSEISAELVLRVIIDDAMGVAATTSFDADEIARTAALAREAAKHADPLKNFSGLYNTNEPVPQLHTFDETVASISPMEKAQSLRTMFDRGRTAGVLFAGNYATSASSIACGNTHGVRRYTTATSSEGIVIALRGSESGYATDIRRGCVDIVALGDEATSKATLRSERVDDITPGAFDVILEPPAIGEVVEWLNMISFSGQSIDDGSSFFVGATGKKLFSENLTLSDDALTDEGLPFPFDVEGLPKRRVPLIERGVVRTPTVDKAYADRLNIAPTATAWSLGGGDHGTSFHTAIEPGDATREELIASTKRGIWVTRFNYVNGLLEPKSALMTGTTRDGTFLIENGEVVARLPNLRWTQSIVEAFANVEALTKERRRAGAWFNSYGATLAPVMKIRDWKFTGKQK